jgi:hypothetical protein
MFRFTRLPQVVDFSEFSVALPGGASRLKSGGRIVFRPTGDATSRRSGRQRPYVTLAAGEHATAELTRKNHEQGFSVEDESQADIHLPGLLALRPASQ